MELNNFKKSLLACRNKELLEKKLEALALSKLELIIMKKRYVDCLLIKQIPEFLNVSERWVKKVHARAINKTLDGLNVSDLLELGIHLKITPRSLFEA